VASALDDGISENEENVVLYDNYNNDDDEEMADKHVMTFCWGFIDVNKECFFRNRRIIAYGLVMVMAVVALACVTILGDSWTLVYVSAGVFGVIVVGSFLCLPAIVAKANVYFYLHMVLYLNIGAVIDSFFLSKKAYFPEGPHFTYVFYNTVGSMIGNVAGIFGVAAFPYIFAKRGYRVTLITTVLIQMLASIFDIIIVKRWNLYIGIPDHAMYILGDTIVYQVCYYLAWMPMVLLLSRVCPRGSESLIYALVASSGNLGSAMASTIGSLLVELVWPIVTRPDKTMDFSNLPMLLVVGHLLLPLLIIPLSFLLIPSARICDPINVDGTVVAKTVEPVKDSDKNEPIGESSGLAYDANTPSAK